MKNVFKNLILVVLFVMLSVLGLIRVNAESKDIEVIDIRIKDKSGTIIVEDPTIIDGNISSGIKFNEVGDFVNYEITLKNNEPEKYKISSITDNNDNERLGIEYIYGEDFIAEGETTKITIKLIYKSKLINNNLSLNNLEIKLNFEDEFGSNSQITLNPKTSDNILEYVLLGIVSGLGLFFVITKKRIKGFKIGNLLLIISILIIPFTVLANGKYELSIKFTDVEVKGEFEVYNIKINPKDGSFIVIKDITYGQPIGELPENPEKDGYEFVKWIDEDGNEITEESIITKPIEIEAKYELIRYNITYNLNEGSLSSGKTNPSEYTIESDDITLNNPEKQGYTFIGWSGTGIDGRTTSVTISHGSTEDRSYEAHYSSNEDTEYKVIHKFANLNGDYEIEEVTEYGMTGSTVPAPRKTRTGFVTPPVQNVTIEADGSAEVEYIYNRKSFNVTFDTVGGSTVSEQSIIYEAKASRPTTIPQKTHYTFDDWYTSSTYETKYDFNTMTIIEDTVIYAKWNPTVQTWSMTSDNVHVTDGNITLEVGDQVTGYSVNVDNTTYGDGDWFVMGAQDGKLLITLKSGVGQKVAQGNALNWPSFVANLDSIASHYKNPTYADNSRSINLSDINRVTGFTPYEMESITFTNDNGVIRTKDIPDNVNDYAHAFYYYDFESSSWKSLGNGSSISFASNGYKYGPGPGQNNVNGSEKAYDLIFKDTHDKNWMIDGHVVTYRGNQYWLADAVIMTSSGQGLIYYCFQYIDWEIVDWVIAGNSENNPADSSYSEFDNFVRPVVSLKSEVHINASGTITN